MERQDVFPLVALEGVGELRRFIDEVEAESIARAKAIGATAEDVARHLGITRQGAHYKMKFSEQRLEKVRALREKRGGPPLPPIEPFVPTADQPTDGPPGPAEGGEPAEPR